MKNVLKAFGIIAIVAIMGFSFAACDDDGDGDDGGDKDDGTITIDGWTWDAWGDSDNGGTSTVTMTQGSGNDSKKLTFSGNVQLFAGQIGGYTTIWATPNSENLTSLKNADSFSFKVKGDGKQYQVQVRTSDVTDWNYHRYIFTAPTTESTITVQYSDLAQQTSWGVYVAKTFNKNNITGINFMSTATVTGAGAYNFTIWDLKAGSSTSSGGGNSSQKSIIITGITNFTGKATISVTTNTGYVAGGEGNISNNSVTLPLFVIGDGITTTPWTGNGSYYLVLGIAPDKSQRYAYTNGKTWEELGISDFSDSNLNDLFAKLPKYNINSTTSTIAFSQFKKAE